MADKDDPHSAPTVADARSPSREAPGATVVLGDPLTVRLGQAASPKGASPPLAPASHAHGEAQDPSSRVAPTPISPDPSAVHVSSQIGRFALIRKIGEGGMGVVYVGYDEALDRKVAVKVLHPGAAAASLWIRREAQALAKLSHPNVVPVYEVGEHDGRVFLAMEYVEGRTLRAYLAEKPEVTPLLRAFVQAGRGLAAAHEAGLVHRDFKPDNVLLGKDGRARVVDFGIAVPTDRGPSAATPDKGLRDRPIGASPSALDTPLTDAGAVMGTPSFMSPEQFRGDPATPASDQFSFCVALYRAVYRQAPFVGSQLLELVENVVSGALIPPPQSASAPAWLATVLSRGLSPRPEGRYPDLTTLLDDIESKMPKDPDLDASITLRDRRIALAVLLVCSAGVGVYVGLAGPAAYANGWRLVGLGGAFQGLVLLSVAVLWRRLQRNVQGRQVTGLLIGVPAMIIAHRLIAIPLGSPPIHILTIDTFLLGCVFGCAALVIDRRLGIIAGLGVLGAALSSFFPEIAAATLTILGFVAVAVSVYVSDRWR